MPTKKFALEREGPKRLEVEWKGAYREVYIRWDGDLVRQVLRAELEQGFELAVPDGTVVWFGLKGAGVFGSAKVLTLHLSDGTPVPGSADDPVEAGKQAGYGLYLLAALNAFCGVYAMATGSEELAAAGIGIGSLVMALIFGVLGLFTMRGSRIALGIAIGLYGLDWIMGVVFGVMGGGGAPNVGGIFMRIAILTFLVRSFTTMGRGSRD